MDLLEIQAGKNLVKTGAIMLSCVLKTRPRRHSHSEPSHTALEIHIALVLNSIRMEARQRHRHVTGCYAGVRVQVDWDLITNLLVMVHLIIRNRNRLEAQAGRDATGEHTGEACKHVGSQGSGVEIIIPVKVRDGNNCKEPRKNV